ncbi:Alpha/beta hydrolase family-domain-containing protein [Aspergillus karnatakaensis]|uniref:Alpha/beta hydrolase family-domain-containing protein n=1 Tax=Aspergillus karnatakaensis TaxID=1810916 RepID=UPI003CCD6206
MLGRPQVPRSLRLPRSSVRRHMSHFRVIEHTVRCSHTRERPGAVKPGHENDLKLAVKHYIPLDNPSPKEGDVTLVGAHANGFPKELYEPLWDDIHTSLKKHNKRIRSIWIADVAQQGQSGILNEPILGNDPSWTDHSLDLLSLINTHASEIPHPIIGIGHSMGGMQLAHLSLLHPSLFSGLILIDPVIQRENPGLKYAKASTFRRDLWPSREAAVEKFNSSPFYQAWDKRVLEKWVQFGLRDLPTPLYPDTKEGGVTLASTKAQELYFYLRTSYTDSRTGISRGKPQEEMHPDDAELQTMSEGKEVPFYRPEPANVFRRLPEVKPPVLYLFGEKSEMSSSEAQAQKMRVTGTGVGGSGGVERGTVQEVVLPAGHLVPMEAVKECGEACAGFISQIVSGWERRIEEYRRVWDGVADSERGGVEAQWVEEIGKLGYKSRL